MFLSIMAGCTKGGKDGCTKDTMFLAARTLHKGRKLGLLDHSRTMVFRFLQPRKFSPLEPATSSPSPYSRNQPLPSPSPRQPKATKSNNGQQKQRTAEKQVPPPLSRKYPSSRSPFPKPTPSSKTRTLHEEHKAGLKVHNQALCSSSPWVSASSRPAFLLLQSSSCTSFPLYSWLQHNQQQPTASQQQAKSSSRPTTAIGDIKLQQLLLSLSLSFPLFPAAAGNNLSFLYSSSRPSTLQQADRNIAKALNLPPSGYSFSFHPPAHLPLVPCSRQQLPATCTFPFSPTARNKLPLPFLLLLQPAAQFPPPCSRPAAESCSILANSFLLISSPCCQKPTPLFPLPPIQSKAPSSLYPLAPTEIPLCICCSFTSYSLTFIKYINTSLYCWHC